MPVSMRPGAHSHFPRGFDREPQGSCVALSAVRTLREREHRRKRNVKQLATVPDCGR